MCVNYAILSFTSYENNVCAFCTVVKKYNACWTIMVVIFCCADRTVYVALPVITEVRVGLLPSI